MASGLFTARSSIVWGQSPRSSVAPDDSSRYPEYSSRKVFPVSDSAVDLPGMAEVSVGRTGAPARAATDPNAQTLTVKEAQIWPSKDLQIVPDEDVQALTGQNSRTNAAANTRTPKASANDQKAVNDSYRSGLAAFAGKVRANAALEAFAGPSSAARLPALRPDLPPAQLPPPQVLSALPPALPSTPTGPLLLAFAAPAPRHPTPKSPSRQAWGGLAPSPAPVGDAGSSVVESFRCGAPPLLRAWDLHFGNASAADVGPPAEADYSILERLPAAPNSTERHTTATERFSGPRRAGDSGSAGPVSESFEPIEPASPASPTSSLGDPDLRIHPSNLSNSPSYVLSDTDEEPSKGARVRRESALMASAYAEETRAHLMAGTALVYADLAIKNTIRPARLAAEVAKSNRFFRGVRDGAGHDFGELFFLFKGMLVPASLPQDAKWMPRSRLWRLILLQQKDGHWDLTQVPSLSCYPAYEGLVPAGDLPKAAGIILYFDYSLCLLLFLLHFFKYCLSADNEGARRGSRARWWCRPTSTAKPTRRATRSTTRSTPSRRPSRTTCGGRPRRRRPEGERRSTRSSSGRRCWRSTRWSCCRSAGWTGRRLR